jgi:plasmid stabilization system protein ParE
MDADLRFTSEAAMDIEHAYEWYEQQRAGLGGEFLSCVDAALQLMRRNPLLFAVVHEDFRRALVRRFPYAIFYEYSR